MLDVEQENKASKEAEFVNSVGGKRILVAIRGGDFAHPGNKDAVDLALAPYLQGFFRRILDAGCGLGGTADYIRQIKGGVVYGVDLSDETIVYARTKYPHAHFFRADLMRGEEVKQNLAALENSDSIKTFDLICMFNVIYYVSCQLTMLSTLRAMANNKTKLMIFDYTDSGDYEQHRPKSGLNLLPQPINENNFTQLLSDAGWDLVESEDITQRYIEWYQVFLQDMLNKKTSLLKLPEVSEEIFNAVYKMYNAILESLEAEHLGASIFYAEAASV